MSRVHRRLIRELFPRTSPWRGDTREQAEEYRVTMSHDHWTSVRVRNAEAMDEFRAHTWRSVARGLLDVLGASPEGEAGHE